MKESIGIAEMSSLVTSDAQPWKKAMKQDGTESVSDSAVGRDRFEDLPDGILVHILSFVLTEIAVRASVLSKRWKSLWRDVPNLELTGLDDDELSVTRFQSFVDRVLQLRTSPTVNKFTLYCGENVDPHHISRWIDYAVSHSVQELSIDLLFDDVYCDVHHDDCRFLDSLFTCDSVVKFRLFATGILGLPSLIRFPNLKILTLEWVTFSNEHLTNQLFSNCPVLEELMLNDCTWYCPSVHICCPRLGSLVIFQGPDDGIGSECQIVIHGTSLKVFDYMGECEIECCLVNSVFLVEAYIDVRPSSIMSKTIHEERRIEVADRAHKLLQGLYNVEYLAISSQTLQILNYKEDSFSQMPLFQNLTYLRVYRDPVDIQLRSGLMNFLHACPSIDRLESVEGMFLGVDSPNRTDNLELPPVPVCLWTTLKTLTIHKFSGRMDESCAVRFWLMLMIGRALKSLCVNLSGGQEELKQLFFGLRDLSLSSLVRLCLHEPQCTSGSEAQKLEFGPFSVKFNDH